MIQPNWEVQETESNVTTRRQVIQLLRRILRRTPRPELAAIGVRRSGRPWLRQAAVGVLPPLAIMVIFVVAAILAPYLAPHSPTSINLADSLRPPVWQGGTADHVLGTDKAGRDILSRILYGARISLAVAFVSIVIAGFLGVSLGMLAGYYRGWVESVIMRMVDVFLALPLILLAMLFAVVWGPRIANLLMVLILTLWSVYARLAHAQTLSLKESEHVLAARTIGASDARVLAVHIFPCFLSSIVVLATLQISTVVLMEAALSFLGVGVPPPTPTWGAMIADGRDLVSRAWWVSTIPGIVLTLFVLSANLAGDWLRDYLDPRLRGVGAG